MSGVVQSPQAMLKRVRQLEISLAAKCQLLFGAAVVLIIAAALAVPWQRMEQLTNQLDERSARTLTDYAVAEHAARHASSKAQASTQAVIAVQPPTTRPLGDEGFVAPRLILAGEGKDSGALTAFERKAVNRLRERDREWYPSPYEPDDGVKRYRFARIDSSCMRCHTEQEAPAAIALAAVEGSPPTTQPAQLIGIV